MHYAAAAAAVQYQGGGGAGCTVRRYGVAVWSWCGAVVGVLSFKEGSESLLAAVRTPEARRRSMVLYLPRAGRRPAGRSLTHTRE